MWAVLLASRGHAFLSASPSLLQRRTPPPSALSPAFSTSRSLLAQDIEFKHEEPAELQQVIRALCERDTSRRLHGVEQLMAHEYFQGFDWERLEQGRMEAPVLPSLNEINAPSAKEIEEFKVPEGVEWGPEDVKLFEKWNYASRKLWQEEAIERIKRMKEVSDAPSAGYACCSVQ